MIQLSMKMAFDFFASNTSLPGLGGVVQGGRPGRVLAPDLIQDDFDPQVLTMFSIPIDLAYVSRFSLNANKPKYPSTSFH